MAAALAYFVLIGGTNLGTYDTRFMVVNGALAAALIGIWLWELPRQNDVVDQLMLVALLAFLAVCVTSRFPRSSLDAATSILGYAAAFGVARGELASPRAARALITVLALSGLVLGIGFLASWAPIWLAWWQETGSPPPLELRLPAGPYRHYHPAAMLVIVLVPALLQASRRRIAGPVALSGSVVGVAVAFMSGSRTIWFALAVGGLLAALLYLRPSRRTMLRGLIGLAAVVAVVSLVLAVSAVGQELMQRLANTSTLLARFGIWQNSLHQWLERPIVGWGPGSFGSVITLSPYFARFDAIGRHADNAVFQVLLEGGLVGLLSMTAAVTALAAGARRAESRRSRYALLGLALFGLMSFTDNPSDTPTIVMVGLCWAALAVPRDVAPSETPSRRPGWRMAAIGVAAAAIALAVARTHLASAAFDEGRALLGNDDLWAAREALDRAVEFDPGMALYVRERGVRAAQAGQMLAAVKDLERAASLNPADTTALRALAVTYTADGRVDLGLRWAQRAVDLRPLELENQLALASVAERAGERQRAAEAVRVALQLQPWSPATPSWAQVLPTGPALAESLRAADDAWRVAAETSPRFSYPQAWLRAMTDRDPFEPAGGDFRAVDAIIRCDFDRAAALLSAPESHGNGLVGLTARIMLASASNDQQGLRSAIRLAELWGNELAVLARATQTAASAFSDRGEDLRLYERVPLPPAAVDPMLPTPEEGLAAWLQDPRAAAQRGAPESGLASCGN